jgi:hypothetical protein
MRTQTKVCATWWHGLQPVKEDEVENSRQHPLGRQNEPLVEESIKAPVGMRTLS